MKQLKDFYTELILTNDQSAAVEQLQSFIHGDSKIFILNGYAGSGKTTLLKGIVHYLKEVHRPVQLMAPTGRAAKVIHDKTEETATTIHKGIYSFDDLKEIETQVESKVQGSTFLYEFKIYQDQNSLNKVIIIDEASMVSNNLSQGEFFRFGSGHLMNDLFTYARMNDDNLNVKIIFVGDPAQLPPIGMNFSPALSEEYLTEEFKIVPEIAELKEVKRQSSENGILASASKIRKGLTSGYFNDFNINANGIDRFQLNYDSFFNDYIEMPFPKQIIAYKNKTTQEINARIRELKYGEVVVMQAGDVVISGSNNYASNILNGEFAVVNEVSDNIIYRKVSFKRKGGEVVTVELEWRYVTLLADDASVVSGYMLRNYLNGETYLLADEMRALYVDFKNRHLKLKPNTEEFKQAIKSDPYFNCLMLKYGYAVTCHKAQGGEWERTIVVWDKGVDKNHFSEGDQTKKGKNSADFYRWAYTAITRASKELYSLNPPHFNSYSSMIFVDPAVQESFEQLTGKNLVPVEIEIDDQLKGLMLSFSLTDSPLQLQDHFIKLWFNFKNKNIDIVNWERKGYEIWFQLKREEDKCAIKFWVNGKYQFKSNYAQVPSLTNSETLLQEVNSIIGSAKDIVVKRNHIESIESKIEFEVDIEENTPFLGNLFSDLSELIIAGDISIDLIEHLSWKERYSFSRGPENAQIDFEYNKSGFFGRVVPIPGKFSSNDLLNDVKIIVNNLNSQ